MWHLNNISKVLYLYWGRNKPLSFMRFMTVCSFVKLNPDWEIKVYYPLVSCDEIPWKSDAHKESYYNGRDYFEDLASLGNVDLVQFNFNDIGFSNQIPEVFKSDILRLYLLSQYGGVWSDFDILYFRPIEKLSINTAKHSEMTTGVCYLMSSVEKGQLPEHRIGFLLSAVEKESLFFTQLYNNCFDSIDLDNYQCLGAGLYNISTEFTSENVGRVMQYGNDKICNIPIHAVYPMPQTADGFMERFYEEEDLQVHKKTIGIHWYAGSCISSEYEEFYNEDSINKYKNSFFFSKLRESYEK